MERPHPCGADIEANGLDGVLFCGASPRDEATPWQLPVQVEHVNLREQCVLAYKNPDGSAVSGAAPALLTQMATDYVNMGVVKLQKSNMPESAAIEGIKRILVIGGGWTGLTAAQEAAKTGYEVILVEKADKLGGAVNNMPMGSPLQAPWEDRQPTNLAEKIAAVTGNSSITVLLNSHMAKLEGQPGEFKATVATANGEQTFDIGSVVLATGWVPLAEKYLESMGLGVNPKVVHAAQFAKMLGEGKVDARRIAFVLDTTIAEEALQKAADEAAAAEAEAPAEAPAEEEEKGFVKENLESIKHLRYSNAVNSVGMLRMANIICDKTDDAVQAFVLYKDMTIPGILERFYKKMQDRLGLMMTKADVTDIRDAGNHIFRRGVGGLPDTVAPSDLLVRAGLEIWWCCPRASCPRPPRTWWWNSTTVRAPTSRICSSSTVSRTPTTSASPTKPAVPVSTPPAACVSPRPWTPVKKTPAVPCSKPSSVWKPLPTVWPCIPAPATIPTRCSTSCAAPSASAAPKNVPSAPWTTTKRVRPNPTRPAAVVAVPASAPALSA